MGRTNINWDNIQDTINNLMTRFYNRELSSRQVETKFFKDTGKRAVFETIKKHWKGDDF